MLFHKTLNDYLTPFNFIHNVLSTAFIPIQPEQLWLKSFVQFVLKYDLPQDKVFRIWNRTKALSPEYSVDSFQDDKSLNTARIMSSNGSGSIDSGIAFLDCAIANLPTYPTPDASFSASEQSLYEQALGSPIMILHFVMDRHRDTCGSHQGYDCSVWCRSHAFGEVQFALSSEQRAMILMTLHEKLHVANIYNRGCL